MYVEFMKNFVVASELLAVPASYWLLDSFCLPETKMFESYFLDMMYVEFMKNILVAIRASGWLLDSFFFLSPKTFDPTF